MKKFSAPMALALVVSAAALSACDNLEKLDKTVSIKFDPQVSEADKAMIRADVAKLRSYGIKAPTGSYYQKAFGGTDSISALKFLDERINYIIPESADLLKRLRLGPFPLPVSGGGSKADDGTNCQKDKDGNPILDEKGKCLPKGVVMASNTGTALFFIQKMNPLPVAFKFKIGDTSVPLDSPRVGIMQIGMGYTMDKSPSGKPITAVIRTETLVHEARHSDCTGGLAASDLARLQAGMLPENHSCGHTHVNCPEGHPLSGLPACDAHAWGAYMIGALYSQQIAKNCSNCTELERQQALSSTTDSFSRLLLLDDMLSGKAGDPDMSSSDQIRKNDKVVRAIRDAAKTRFESGSTAPAQLIIEGSEEGESPMGGKDGGGGGPIGPTPTTDYPESAI